MRYGSIISVLVLSVVVPIFPSDRDDDIGRIDAATEAFQEIMSTPDKSIPTDLLKSSKCIAIIPGEKKVQRADSPCLD